MNACPDVWLEGLQPLPEMFNRSVIISDETGLILFANSTVLLHLNKFTIRNLSCETFCFTLAAVRIDSQARVLQIRWCQSSPCGGR